VQAVDFRLAFDAGKSLADRYALGIGSLNVVKEGLRLPDAESRSESERTMSESQKWLRANAVVLGGTGFIASAARATYAAIQLAVRSQCPQKVFGEVSPACQWLATILRLDFDPAELESSIEGATRDLVDASTSTSVSPRRSPP
jgi:hypothetical protein